MFLIPFIQVIISNREFSIDGVEKRRIGDTNLHLGVSVSSTGDETLIGPPARAFAVSQQKVSDRQRIYDRRIHSGFSFSKQSQNQVCYC